MNKSESIKEIAIALNKFQNEISNPKNSEANSFFKSKYAPLSEVINHCKPIWTKFGLSAIQNVSGDGERIVITTLLTHVSGEWMESETLILKNQENKGVSDAQAAGISITYARRYQLSAMLGISSEDDTDGNNSYQQSNNLHQNNDSVSENKFTELTDKQIKRLYAIASSKGINEVAVKKAIETDYKKHSAEELTKIEYDALCSRLEKAKGSA